MTAPSLAFDRRQIMKMLGIALAAPAAGCVGDEEKIVRQRQLIDVHAHIFNASDLPVERFVRYCFLDLYPKQGQTEALRIQDPDFVDGMMVLFTHVLGAERAPSAKAEMARLGGDEFAPDYDEADLDTLIVQRVASFLDAAPMADGRESLGNGIAKVQRAIIDAAETVPPVDVPTMPNGNELTAPQFRRPNLLRALRAYWSDTLPGRALRWFKLFKMYRYALVDKWIADHATGDISPVLMAPAMIDYSCWLQQKVTSPLADQARVMGMIGRRQTKVAIHGYVAFDPLRHAYFRRGIAEAEFDPLAVAEEALTEHGYLGVKLYPPMGFKATGNSNKRTDYHQHIGQRLGDNIGTELDTSLEALYKLCERLSAPILAHATDSNESGPGYERRADPHFWRPVFKAHDKLHICLAHFGRFQARSADTTMSTPLPAASWEWNFGHFVRDNPNAPVFADLSFWSEVVGGSADERSTLAATMRAYIEAFDSKVEHLMFGTDWVMVGIVRKYAKYDASIIDFLRGPCGLADEAVERILIGNARRFMRLGPGEPTRNRLDAYYRANHLAPREF